MGKRSDFVRNKGDYYVTPFNLVHDLIPHLGMIQTYDEPCVGNGALVEHLAHYGLTCTRAVDIETKEMVFKTPEVEIMDAMNITECRGDAFITNPPWTREILHPLIMHLSSLAPTWLLFDADWAHTVQATPFGHRCAKIVSIGRAKWIPGSKYSGKDNAAWYLFDHQHTGSTAFIFRTPKTSLTSKET